jgi:hypothetical protein
LGSLFDDGNLFGRKAHFHFFKNHIFLIWLYLVITSGL